MDRSSFLKKLGIGLGVAIITPQVFAEKENFGDFTFPIPNKTPPIDESKLRGNINGWDKPEWGTKGILRQLQESSNHRFYTDCYSQELFDDLVLTFKQP